MWELSSSSVTATCLQCCKIDSGEGWVKTPTQRQNPPHHRKNTVRAATWSTFTNGHAVADFSISPQHSSEGANWKYFLFHLSLKHKPTFLYLLSTNEVANRSSDSTPHGHSVHRLREWTEATCRTNQLFTIKFSTHHSISVNHDRCLPIHWIGNEESRKLEK